ncbi:MAG: M15 family metallopeptidase [Oscillospiraceae bacterium]|nr:M15 family metallopeptidase [Oscillospiraceae bacterium]
MRKAVASLIFIIAVLLLLPLFTLTIRESEIDNEWALWLINGKNPLPQGYQPELASIGSWSENGQNRYLDSRVAPYALQMMSAASEAGLFLDPASAYRNISTQETNFRNEFNNWLKKGYSRQEAFDLTMRVIAAPGTSEHNAGLSIDFTPYETRFEQKPEFAWLLENAHKYGFILRYPKYSVDITGISYEPWHWRFVGVYHAGKIRESELTLEEYIGICAGDESVVRSWRTELGLF